MKKEQTLREALRAFNFATWRLEIELRRCILRTKFCITLLFTVPMFMLIYMGLDIIARILNAIIGN